MSSNPASMSAPSGPAGDNLPLSTAPGSNSAPTPTTPITITSSIVDEIMDENTKKTERPNPDPNRWFFTKEQLENTASRRAGIETDKELTYRQQSANFIQDIGQRLQVNQLCINTAIVYMHRFYMYHSFNVFHRNSVCTASIFLAAKVEEQPRKLEYVIKVAHYCLFRDSQPPIDLKSESYAHLASELVSNENILLQTLGFDVAIDHPHTHVVKCCQLVRASKDLAQTSYFMATNSLHLTTMSLEYRSSVVACVCIHLACKWSNWEIPRSKEGKDWFWYVDGNVTLEQLEQITNEFLTIFNKSPSRLKKKIISLSAATRGNSSNLTAFPTHFNLEPTSPGAPQISTKSRSPSPESNAGKLRLPSVKPGVAQPLFPMRPGTKPGASTSSSHHSVNKPHPVSSSNHPSNAAALPYQRQGQVHVPSVHQVPNKPGHHHTVQSHAMGLHLVPKEHQKTHPYPPGYHHQLASLSGQPQNSHAPGGNRLQSSHIHGSSNAHLSSTLHSANTIKPAQLPLPALKGPGQIPNWKPPFAVTGTQQQQTPAKPHHSTMKPPTGVAPGQQRPIVPHIQHQAQAHSLKRPYPTEHVRSENRVEPPIKKEPAFPGPRPSLNHLPIPQAQSHMQSLVRPRPPEKPGMKHPVAQSGTMPVHQASEVTSQNNNSVSTRSLPPAADVRPWMDRFMDNEIQITQSQPVKPVTVKRELHVSSSGLSDAQPASGFSVQVSSSSSTSTPAPSMPVLTPTMTLPSTSNALPLLTAATFPSSSTSLLGDSEGSSHEIKKKKDKKHKKDKHRDEESGGHEKKKKHKKDKHKEKHKKDKHRAPDDFTIDQGNSASKLKIIIGRNPNAAQESKDSKSKHSKDHHTATIVNY